MTSRAIPRSIWALGFVSMLMDVSSEMIHALLPVYLTTVMGASATMVGAIEGIAEATASVTKVFSGAVSYWFSRRKFLVVLGYGLAAITKPVFPLAPTIGWLVGARFVDRIGKGIRGAPRDALLAASLAAGVLWDQVGSQATFVAGAAVAVCALGGLLVAGPKLAEDYGSRSRNL